jgi:prolyl oligopeptidase
VFYKDLQQPGAKVVELLNDFDAEYDFVGNEGTLFWFRTDLKAPRGRVIAIDVARPERGHWQEIIPESAPTLQQVRFVNRQFLASYLRDAQTQVKVFRPDGSFVREVELPGIGTAIGFRGRREHTGPSTRLPATVPMTIYRYDLSPRAAAS